MSSLRLQPSSGAPIDLPSDRVLIGRDPGCDVLVNDPSVSRRHAVVERRGSFWVVLDQRSANGTWLDDRRVDQAALQDGQRLRLGAVSFVVSIGAPPVVAAPPAAVAPPAVVPRRPEPPSPASPIAVRPPEAPAVASAALRPPAPSSAAVMDAAEAAEILGLWPGSPAEEVRKRYQKMFNDFQIRLTNAPTPSLKKMYQKSLQDLKTAAETLCPGAIGS